MELQYLYSHGVPCTISRVPPVAAKVSMKQTTKGTNFGLRESAYEGWINVVLSVGEVFAVDNDTYIIYSANPLRRVYSFTAMKCNSRISALHLTLGEDQNGNLTETYTPIATDKDVYGQIITNFLRATDPGLLPTTTRVYAISSSINVSVLDRIVHQCTQTEAIDMGMVYDPLYGGARFKVDSIDDILISGLKCIQVSPDTRRS